VTGITSYQKGLYGLAEAGGALIVLGVIVLVIDIAASVGGRRGRPAGDDPYEGLTLEWATSSPPPPYGFDSLPEVRSAAPLAHLRGAGAGGSRPDADGSSGEAGQTALPAKAGS